MAQTTEEVVPTLQEVVSEAEKRLAGLRKDASERRKWLANNVPDLNVKLATPATQALFATKLCAAIEAQPPEILPISAEQLVQSLSEQLEDIQKLVRNKKAEIEESKINQTKVKDEVELLVRLRKLRQTEGEMLDDERLTEKLAAVNRLFKTQRKWLMTMINEIFADDDDMTDLLMNLTSAFFSEGDLYIDAVTDSEQISSNLLSLISSGIVMRHPYDHNRIRLQDLS